MKKVLILFAGIFLFFFSSSAQNGASPNNESSLYSRLGGANAIDMLLGESLANIVSDKTINRRFAKTDVKKLKENWNNIICNKTGSNCSLPTFPEKFVASDPEWEAGIGDITKALDRFKVKEPEKSELLAVLNDLRKDYFKN